MCYNKDNKQDEEVINMRNPLIITIGREYGSGGREIGELVAKTLGIAYYDKKLITLAAQKSGLSDEFIANNEQRVRSGFMQNLAASAVSEGMNARIRREPRFSPYPPAFQRSFQCPSARS